MGGYDHTQRGVLHWLLGGLAVLFLALAPTAYEDEAVAGLILTGVALLLGGLAPCFAHLRVRDRGADLEIGFGPWRVFRTQVPYDEILSAAPGRSALIDGWGIHLIPGRGWTWNIHGFAAVELRLRGGKRLRIGTDDREGLAAFLAARAGLPPAAGAP